jgi:hypothetical protein
MWPNYHLLEARRLAAERVRESEQARLAREASRYRLDHQDGEPSALRRSAARVALAASRVSLRIARTLDECVGDAARTSNGATPLG